MIASESGPVQRARLEDAEVHQVGHAPTPWNRADWEYATSGRFPGQVGRPERALACEVRRCLSGRLLSRSPRGVSPRPQLQTGIEVIESDDEDDGDPTVAPGTLDRRV